MHSYIFFSYFVESDNIPASDIHWSAELGSCHHLYSVYHHPSVTGLYQWPIEETHPSHTSPHPCPASSGTSIQTLLVLVMNPSW